MQVLPTLQALTLRTRLMGCCLQAPAEMEARTAATTQLLMWQLYETQARMRQAIDEQQTQILGLQDRAYRKFTRNCWRMRQDAAKQVLPPWQAWLCEALTPVLRLPMLVQRLGSAAGQGVEPCQADGCCTCVRDLAGDIQQPGTGPSARGAHTLTGGRAQEDRERQARLNERMAGLKAWRQGANDRQVAAKDARTVRNRAVLRTHERLARSASKARGDDRAQRLAALKVRPEHRSLWPRPA